MRALIFDLDGTLVDSAYAHARAWQGAFEAIGWVVPAWETHRLIGMSGELLVKTIFRARGARPTQEQAKKLENARRQLFLQAHECAPLPGARELLKELVAARVPHGIATSGQRQDIGAALKALKISKATQVVDGDSVKAAKPEPDLWLACQRRLKVPSKDCLIVGDAIWDIHAARRSGIASVGVLTGGFGEQELYNAGAMRVYRDLADLHRQIDQLGIEL